MNFHFRDRLTDMLGLHGHESGLEERHARLLEAVERAVENTDPLIRTLHDYRERLAEVVATSLDYVDGLVEEIPGFVEIRRDAFGRDPRVPAFFVNGQDLQRAYGQSSELRDYLDDPVNVSNDEGCALLCMNKSERRVLGMDLKDEQVQRDVPLTVVNFSDHHINSPAHSESEAREALKHCLFEGLLTRAMEQLAGRRHQQALDQAELVGLRRTLTRAEQGQNGESGMSYEEQRGLRRRIRVLEQGLPSIGQAGPVRSLELVRAVLANPERHIRMQRVSIQLDDMGVVVDAGSSRNGRTIEFAEVVIGESNRRAVVLAKFAREEMPPRPDFLEQASRYLAV